VAETTPLDFQKALAIVGGDRDLLLELATVFLDQLPGQLRELRRAVAMADPEGTREAAHSLKGSLGNLGATAAWEAARALEGLGRSGSLEGVAAAVATLERELDRLTQFLARPGWNGLG
jgi:HPt (histidine-containing phosphotransfer) domain-containing protein